jgi:hypothetical protein
VASAGSRGQKSYLRSKERTESVKRECWGISFPGRGIAGWGLTFRTAWKEASQNEYKAKTFIQCVTRAQQLLTVITRPKRADL